MMPQNVLSTVAMQAAFLYPKNLPITGIESYELGGVALNNPSLGLMYQAWHAYYDAPNIFLGPIGGPYSVFMVRPDLSELSLTFDQNMNPFIAYVQAGIAKFYWWDTLINAYQDTTLPAGTVNPRASLDDKRTFNLGSSDIILGYLRNGNFYTRMQRDRYNIEYLQKADINLSIVSPVLFDVGMARNNRLQFLIYGDFFPV